MQCIANWVDTYNRQCIYFRPFFHLTDIKQPIRRLLPVKALQSCEKPRPSLSWDGPPGKWKVCAETNAARNETSHVALA